MIRFGTGGWRAVIGEDFICANIRKVAAGVCGYLKENGKDEKPVIIGYDHRFLSDTAARWMAEVLCAAGIHVYFLKRSAPTPLIMHTVKGRGLHCGLEVTASHNPASYNGIKVIVDEGRDAPLEVTGRLEEIIGTLEGDIPFTPFDRACEEGGVEFLRNPFNPFLDDIISQMDMAAIRERGPRILFDPMYGSGTYALMCILYTARCTVDTIHMGRDAYFGGNLPAPTEDTLHELTTRVVSGGYDLGIALDGDGDRLGIIDSNGRYINANEILVMLYYYLHEYRGWKGPVVRNMSTTHMLDRVAEDLGEVCYEVPVGFKWISSKIDEVDAVLGGESSGGLTVRGHIHGKDSTYAAALFVEMISAMKKSPTEIVEMLEKKYGKYVMAEGNYAFAPNDRQRIHNLVFTEKILPDFGRDIDRVSYEDGCKVYFSDGGFVTCRFSGTEPLLRIFAEAGEKERAQASIDAFRAALGL
ncbi:MAG: phosphoglucomutase/phosphomannomutase family protein [Clostridia bacterium]|nr:phosphoglucomutase/phosphomannomutase family protein [Clostridia bacterium]